MSRNDVFMLSHKTLQEHGLSRLNTQVSLIPGHLNSIQCALPLDSIHPKFVNSHFSETIHSSLHLFSILSKLFQEPNPHIPSNHSHPPHEFLKLEKSLSLISFIPIFSNLKDHRQATETYEWLKSLCAIFCFLGYQTGNLFPVSNLPPPQPGISLFLHDNVAGLEAPRKDLPKILTTCLQNGCPSSRPYLLLGGHLPYSFQGH